MTLAVIWSTTFNLAHFGDESVPLADRLFAAQTIVLVGALLVLMLAALFAERRWSEAALKESKERLQLALDGAKLGAFSINLGSGDIEFHARAAQSATPDDEGREALRASGGSGANRHNPQRGEANGWCLAR